MEEERGVEQRINPYFLYIFGEGAKTIILYMLLIPTVWIIIYGMINNWLDQNFIIELLFLFIGILIGRWFKNGNK